MSPALGSLFIASRLLPVQARRRGSQNGSYWTTLLSHLPSHLSPVPSRPVSEENSKDHDKLERREMFGLNPAKQFRQTGIKVQLEHAISSNTIDSAHF